MMFNNIEYFYSKIEARIKLLKKISFKKDIQYPPFGKYLWSKHRENIPYEKETFLEKKVYDDLKKHFSSKHIGLPKFTAELLQKCLENGWYKDILHEPPYKFLYRGLKISSEKKLLQLLNIDKSELNDKGSIDFGKSINNENGYSTSWTFSKKITKDFSTNYGKAKRGFSITLIAELKENRNKFLAGPGGLYNVYGLSKWHLEKETVGLEPILIKKIEWERL